MSAQQSFDRRALCVVEAAYRIVDGTDAWLDGVLAAARSLLDAGLGAIAYTYRLADDGRMFLTSAPRGTGGALPAYAEEGTRYAERTPPALVRAMFVADPPVVTLSELWRSMPHDRFPEFRPFESMAAHGLGDYLAVRGCNPSGTGLMIGALFDRPRVVHEIEVERWRLLRAHLLAGLRLGRGLEDEAVLEPGGRVVHAEKAARSARALEALRRRARQIDRARSAPGRRDPAHALEAWEGLVSGRWSLIDRFDSDGRRYLVARRNDPHAAAPRALSARERQILAYAALGYANKHIAYTLGLAPSTVSSHLRTAMRRIGVPSRAALADLWSPSSGAEAEAALQDPADRSPA